MTRKFRFICATRKSKQRFFTKTALGRSLEIYKFPFAEIRLFSDNRNGLPFIYNQAIDEAENDPAILIFIHDDVHLCDFYWQTHLLNALQVFEVIGLAGNKRRVERQPAWNLIDDKRTWDTAENLSGIVGHGKGYPFDPQNFNVFGPPCQQVKLLDVYDLTNALIFTSMIWIFVDRRRQKILKWAPGLFQSSTRAMVALEAQVGDPDTLDIFLNGRANWSAMPANPCQ